MDLREEKILLEKRKKEVVVVVVVVRFNKRMFVCLLFFLSATKRVVDFVAFLRFNKP